MTSADTQCMVYSGQCYLHLLNVCGRCRYDVGINIPYIKCLGSAIVDESSIFVGCHEWSR